MTIVSMETLGDRDRTIGFATFFGPAGEFKCCTLERPWNDNQPCTEEYLATGKGPRPSCIPAGRYKSEWFNSPTYGWVLRLKDVPDRSDILAHWGNFVKNTVGCICMGSGIDDINDDGVFDVVNSKTTIKRFNAAVEEMYPIGDLAPGPDFVISRYGHIMPDGVVRAG